MPELPEVETTRQCLIHTLPGRSLTRVVIRETRLRHGVPADLAQKLEGRVLQDIWRRAKYLLFQFDHGVLLAHLGMTGTLGLMPAGTPHRRHDHVDFVFGELMMRYHDPRRFGALLWIEGEPSIHPLLAKLGPEPLEPGFDGETLYRATRGRTAAIKQVIMDAKVVVGVGNIYASEALFGAGIRPQKTAGSLSRKHCAALAASIIDTLHAAIKAGGSTLRDFVSADQRPGYFQQQHLVYDRAGQACRRCGATVQHLTQGQRSSYYCPRCQK